MNRRDLLKLFPFLWILLVGCGSYGWASRSDGQRPQAVSTVDIDPHTGVDGALLTRHLREELEHRGMATTWGSDKETLRCRVDLWDQMGFGNAMTIRAEAICTGIGENVSRIAKAQATLDDDDTNGSSLEVLREQAALQALSQIAVPLAQRVRTP